MTALWAPPTIPAPATINPSRIESLSTAGVAPLRTTASTAWPAANRAIFVPFILSSPMLVTQLFALIGAISSGNIDVGIYDRAGTKIVSSGSTVMGTINVLQLFNITDVVLGPGRYFMACAVANATGTVFAGASTARRYVAQGVCQQATAFPLQATATFAAAAAAFCPVIGVANQIY